MTLADLGTKSVRRNALIADLLHRIDVIEKAGTGIRRIREEARLGGYPEPVFEANGFTTAIFRPSPEVRTAADDRSTAQESRQVTPQVPDKYPTSPDRSREGSGTAHARSFAGGFGATQPGALRQRAPERARRGRLNRDDHPRQTAQQQAGLPLDPRGGRVPEEDAGEEVGGENRRLGPVPNLCQRKNKMSFKSDRVRLGLKRGKRHK